MSNRGRRAWLLNARMKAAVKYGCGDLLMNQGDNCATYAEYKGVVRQTVLEIDRPPLSFASNRQGSDSFGGSLINLQMRNAQSRAFDLLRDELWNALDTAGGCRLWSYYQDDLESAHSVFEQSREILASLWRVNHPAHDELQWTAVAHRAARSLSYRRSPIFQYADRYGSVLDSARHFWPELNPCGGWKSAPLADHEVYALLAMDEAHLSVESLVELLQQFDLWADEKGISGDADDFEALRDEVARWEREESRYAIRRLAQARDLLHLAQLANVGADSKKAREYMEGLEREVQQRIEALAAAAPLAETGKVFTEGRSKGGRSRKEKVYSPFKTAVARLCAALGTYAPKEVLREMRRDCEDDDEGDSNSEVMNDIRGAAENPVLLRFQSVPDDLSDAKANICFVLTNTGVEETATVGTFRNVVSAANPNKPKKSLDKIT